MNARLVIDIYSTSISKQIQTMCSAFHRITHVSSLCGLVAGAGKKGEPAAFAVKYYGFATQASVPKSLRVFISRCGNMVAGDDDVPVEKVGAGRAKNRGRLMRKGYNDRRRAHGGQGRVPLCPELRSELFQWFIGVRKVVKGRLWGCHVIAAANNIIKQIVKHHTDRGLNVPRIPKISPMWMWRWARDYGISFRKPNRRYKVSRSKMKSGLVITWKNCFRARLCFRLLFQKERRARGLPEDPITHHVDQKPVHFNEADSKDVGTLHTMGDDEVPLKSNHSASRSRLTANTMVTYPQPAPDVPGVAYTPPIEILFKLKTDRTIKGLQVPPGVNMTITHSASGSYNEEAFIQYLERHLLPLTAERIGSADWRILALDAFEAHKTTRVKEFAKTRGYLVMYHRGGNTPVGQWNDTDLHVAFEKQYLHLETLDFNAQLAEKPWRVPARPRQSIITDISCVWLALPHASIAKRAAAYTGWSIALPEMRSDGTFETFAAEDHLVAREARVFWDEADMPRQRADDLQIVYRAWQDGRINTWADVWDFMLEFETDDIQVEGQELLDGGGCDDDDPPWLDPGAVDSIADVAASPPSAAASAADVPAARASSSQSAPSVGAGAPVAAAMGLCLSEEASLPVELCISRCTLQTFE